MIVYLLNCGSTFSLCGIGQGLAKYAQRAELWCETEYIKHVHDFIVHDFKLAKD